MRTLCIPAGIAAVLATVGLGACGDSSKATVPINTGPGAPTCVGASAGTSCGTDQVCDGSGKCVACTSGAACDANPTSCKVGAIACAMGPEACVDTKADAGAGKPCGTNQVCDGSGKCVACAEGATCATNPTPCKVGATTCSTAPIGCADTKADSMAGASCGTNQVCNGMGSCVGCMAGQACATNSNPCRVGVVECTAGPACANSNTNADAGTKCGAAQLCAPGGDCASLKSWTGMQSKFTGGNAGYYTWNGSSFSISGTFTGGFSVNFWNPSDAMPWLFDVSADLTCSNGGGAPSEPVVFLMTQAQMATTPTSASGSTVGVFGLYLANGVMAVNVNGQNETNLTAPAFGTTLHVKRNLTSHFEVYQGSTLVYTTTGTSSAPLYVGFGGDFDSLALFSRCVAMSNISVSYY